MTFHSRRWLPTGFDRDLKLLQLSIACRRVVTGFLGVVRAIYFALIGFDPVTIGVLLSIPMVTGAFRSIVFGLFSDRYGRKSFLILGGAFSTLHLIIYALSQDFWLLVVAQGVGAMGEGVGSGQPVVSGFITDKTKTRERVGVFNALAFTNGIASIVGSLMAGLPAFFDFNLGLGMVEAHALLFWIGTAFSGFSLLLTFLLQEKKPLERRRKKGFLEIKSWGTIGKFSFVRSMSGLGFGLITSLLPLYFYLRFDVGSDALGPLYALSRFISMISYLLVPKVVTVLGDLRIIIATRTVASGIALLFPLASAYQPAAILLVAFRATLMFGIPVRQSFATDLVSPLETASTIGISNFVRMSVRAAAPTIAGYLFAAASLSLPFIAGAVLLSVNALLYRLFFHQIDNKHNTRILSEPQLEGKA